MRSTVLLAGLAACAHTPESVVSQPDASDTSSTIEETSLSARSDAADAQVASDLERLDALTLFQVGELVGGDASNAFQCYGECPDAADTVADYEARAVALHSLVEVAEQAADDVSSADACEMDDVAEHLDTLRALNVVEVGAFVAQTAAASPYCYNLPCPADLAAAHETNCVRANTLATLAGTLAE